MVGFAAGARAAACCLACRSGVLSEPAQEFPAVPGFQWIQVRDDQVTSRSRWLQWPLGDPVPAEERDSPLWLALVRAKTEALVRTHRGAPNMAHEPSHTGSAGAPATGAPTLVVLIDDVRRFRDQRPCHVARSSAAGVALLHTLHGLRIDELWLDHDLDGEDTIWPVMHLLEDAALAGQALEIGMVYVHASRSGPAHQMVSTLRRSGYRVQRWTNPRSFTW